MRGSPLTRTLVMALLLAVAGFGLLRLTAARAPAAAAASSSSAAGTDSGEAPRSLASYDLLLSAPASWIELDGGLGEPLRAEGPASRFDGRLALDPVERQVIVRVEWAAPVPEGEHRFAKLELALPRQATVSHVFVAGGPIHDLFELPAVSE